MSRYMLDNKSTSKTSFIVWGVLLAALATGAAYYYAGRVQLPQKAEGDNGGSQVSMELAIPQQSEPVATESAAGSGAPKSAAAAKGQATTVSPVAQQIAGSPTADIALPELRNSDTMFKEDISKLSPGLAKWFASEQLISRYLTLINDLSQGQRVFKHASFLQLDVPFKPKRNAHGYYMDAQTYRRYDAFASAVEALDVQACLALYKKYRPLMQEVFDTFSYPHNYHIEDIIQKAGANILLAPLIDRPIGLVPHGTRYKFADPQLEGLDSVQRQLLRMGPENTKRIQDKVRQLLQAFAA